MIEQLTYACKNTTCDEIIKVEPGSSRRVRCPKCGTIFLPESSYWAPYKLGPRKYPECFSNFELTDPICQKECKAAKACKNQSPPVDADYFHYSEAAEGTGAERICPKCGSAGRGLFCSNCGTALDSRRPERPLPLRILRAFFADWPEYYRTIKASLFHPREFFSGAFSPQSGYFHVKTGTLPPAEFLLVHFVVTGILTSLLGFLLFGNYVDENFFQGLFDLVLAIAFMYVPAFFLNIVLTWNLGSWQQRRRMNLSYTGTLNLETTLRCFIYATPVEILSIPLILSLTAVFTDMDLNLPIFIGSLVLAYIGKMISMYILLPNALWFSSRIPPDIARTAVIQLYMIPVVLSQFFRLCTGTF
jgi:hypothetical protein